MSQPFGSQLPAGTVVDEIGIEIGIYGAWRLKAEFTPVFASTRNGFHAVAVEGAIRPFMFGREVEERMFRRAVTPRDRPIVAAIGAALALRNLAHTGMAGLKLILRADPGMTVSPATIRAAARGLAGEIGRNNLEPAELFVDLTRLADTGEHTLHAAFAALRSRSIGVALREQGDGIVFAEPAPEPFPDLVVIDGAWFRAVARQPATAQLLAALLRGYRSQGAIVLVEGVTTASELRVALHAGADWLSGPLLSPSGLAGAVFPENAPPIETLLDQRRVVSLFG